MGIVGNYRDSYRLIEELYTGIEKFKQIYIHYYLLLMESLAINWITQHGRFRSNSSMCRRLDVAMNTANGSV